MPSGGTGLTNGAVLAALPVRGRGLRAASSVGALRAGGTAARLAVENAAATDARTQLASADLARGRARQVAGQFEVAGNVIARQPFLQQPNDIRDSSCAGAGMIVQEDQRVQFLVADA